jgi:hypothetical protein
MTFASRREGTATLRPRVRERSAGSPNITAAVGSAVSSISAARRRSRTRTPQPEAVGWIHNESTSGVSNLSGDMELSHPPSMLVVDAANVVGSRPTGWWRDRPGAARVFTERVRATVAAGRLDPTVTIVLEGLSRTGAVEADVDGVKVVHAPGQGDDTIVAIAEVNIDVDVVVVTADRELARRVRAANAKVVGPNWLLDQLVV